jgi:hypothetical protein
MTDKEEAQALINYLQALVQVQRGSDVKVHAEIRRTVERLEKILGK